MPIGIHRYSVAFTPKKLPPKEELKSRELLKREAYEQFVDALPKHHRTLRLVSTRTIAEPLKRMRVRQSKGGSQTRTALELLAKAEEHYDADGVLSRVKNDGFNKFSEQCCKSKLIQNVSLNSGVFDAAKLHKAVLRAKKSINTCVLKPYATKSINGNGFIYMEKLAPVRSVIKVKSSALASVDILLSVNRLLRQVLLFKGISFADIERDIRQNNGKPVTYTVNTTVEHDPLQLNNIALIRCFKVNKIVVKKTFRLDVNNGGLAEQQCNIFFSSESCRPVKQWLDTINFF